jgi:hypothetical protein
MSEQCRCGSLLCGNVQCKLMGAEITVRQLKIGGHEDCCSICGCALAGNGICPRFSTHSQRQKKIKQGLRQYNSRPRFQFRTCQPAQ